MQKYFVVSNQCGNFLGTLSFIMALGTIIYARVHTLNNAQFYEKLNQTLNLMDVTLRNYFESIATSVNLFSETDLIKEDNDNIKSYVGMADASDSISKVAEVLGTFKV